MKQSRVVEKKKITSGGAAEDEKEIVSSPGPAELLISERCFVLQNAYGVQARRTWGTLPAALQEEWFKLNCDVITSSLTAHPLTEIHENIISKICSKKTFCKDFFDIEYDKMENKAPVASFDGCVRVNLFVHTVCI